MKCQCHSTAWWDCCFLAHVLQLKQSNYIHININTCRVMQLMTQTLNAVQRWVSKRISTLEHKLTTCWFRFMSTKWSFLNENETFFSFVRMVCCAVVWQRRFNISTVCLLRAGNPHLALFAYSFVEVGLAGLNNQEWWAQNLKFHLFIEYTYAAWFHFAPKVWTSLTHGHKMVF